MTALFWVTYIVLLVAALRINPERVALWLIDRRNRRG